MGKIKYTTTIKKCPYCNYTIDVESDFLSSISGVFIFLAFPIAIPYLIIKYIAFQNPVFPKIGPKTISCPNCSLPIRTSNYTVDELYGKDLFLHKFQIWVYICYLFGAVVGVCVGFLFSGYSVVSWFGLFALLSLFGIAVIVVIYWKRIKSFDPQKTEVLEQQKQTFKDNDSTNNDVSSQYLYCRKCGTKLSSDSQYCYKCGTELKF